MTVTYKILPQSLHATANAAIAYFQKSWGIKKAQFLIEALADEINLRPTLHVKMDDGSLLCVEVSDKIYSNTLDGVSLDCRNNGLPVKFFVAVPRDTTHRDYATLLKSAQRAGVGIIEVSTDFGAVIQPALSLSLAGLRHIESANFPAKYRKPLQDAHQTFRAGEPRRHVRSCTMSLRLAHALSVKRCLRKTCGPTKAAMTFNGWLGTPYCAISTERSTAARQLRAQSRHS